MGRVKGSVTGQWEKDAWHWREVTTPAGKMVYGHVPQKAQLSIFSLSETPLLDRSSARHLDADDKS